MLLNYVKSAHRNVMRNKVQSVVQIISLALGLSVFILIAFYVYDEYTVDSSNPYLDQVYRVEELDNPMFGGDVVNFSLGQYILNNIPEILHLTRIMYEPNVPLGYPETADRPAAQTILKSFIRVDPDFQQIFPQEYVMGNPEVLFTEPHAIVLSESAARRLFGEENPLGETVHLWLGNARKKVVGIIRDPVNTHLKFEALFPISFGPGTRDRNGGAIDLNTFGYPMPTYVRLKQSTDRKELEDKLSQLWAAYSRKIYHEVGEREVKIRFRPLKEVHYAEEFDPTKDYMTVVSRTDLLYYLFFGLGILFLGIINYINLSMARASQRSGEMATRRINGSSKPRLVQYLLIESLLTTMVSFLIAATLIQLLFTPFSKLVLADINLYFLGFPLTWLLFLLLILLLGTLAGLYPALSMSYRPVRPLAGWRSGLGTGLIFRRILLLVQFASTGILLIGIFSMQHQINHMKQQELGFDTEQVFFLGSGNLDREGRVDLYHKLKLIPEVENVSYSLPIPGGLLSDDIFEVDDPSSIFHGLELRHMWADLEFFEVYGLRFTHGEEILKQSTYRNLSYSTSDDSVYSYCIINEACRKALKLEDPLGHPTGNRGTIIGVVEDFHVLSLRFPMKPLAIWLTPQGGSWYQSLKLNSSDLSNTLQQIREAHFSIANKSSIPVPGIDNGFNNFEIVSLKNLFDQQYNQAERIRDASVYLSILAAIIACLGLFGLSSFMVQQRTREIGIRKAMGSSERQVFWLLAKDFLKWISLSLVIGLPVGWLIMRSWQKQFAYPADFALWIYGLPILIIFAVSFATIGQQAYRTSRANPVDSLRTE